MIYRSSKILMAAKGAPCMACGRQDDTVVAAHSNQQRDGKGTGIKAHDFRVAYLCHECHAYVDSGQASRAERLERWEGAHRNTVAYLFLSGTVE